MNWKHPTVTLKVNIWFFIFLYKVQFCKIHKSGEIINNYIWSSEIESLLEHENAGPFNTDSVGKR